MLVDRRKLHALGKQVLRRRTDTMSDHELISEIRRVLAQKMKPEEAYQYFSTFNTHLSSLSSEERKLYFDSIFFELKNVGF